MLKVLIDCNEHPAIFNLPYRYDEIGDYLCSAGFWDPSTDLQLLDDDDPHSVQVKLIAETPIDNHLQLLFSQDARLSTINTVCDLFYHLPIEQQIDLTDSMADGHINNEKDLLDAIKSLRPTHDLPAIVFSRVKLWTDTGEECEFFMGGIPESYEDIEDHEDYIDFKEFLEQTPAANMEGITAFITSFSEGDGEGQPADQADIDRIYTAISEIDLDTITGWDKIGESQFAFDYDNDEHLSGGQQMGGYD